MITYQGTHQPHAIYINEYLTKINEQLFSACRKLWKEKKIAGTWTWHGITYAKMHSNRILKITSSDDINKLNFTALASSVSLLMLSCI